MTHYFLGKLEQMQKSMKRRIHKYEWKVLKKIHTNIHTPKERDGAIEEMVNIKVLLQTWNLCKTAFRMMGKANKCHQLLERASRDLPHIIFKKVCLVSGNDASKNRDFACDVNGLCLGGGVASSVEQRCIKHYTINIILVNLSAYVPISTVSEWMRYSLCANRVCVATNEQCVEILNSQVHAMKQTF